MKIETQNPKSMGHSANTSKREIHSDAGLPHQTRKSQSNFILKGTRKRTARIQERRK